MVRVLLVDNYRFGFERKRFLGARPIVAKKCMRNSLSKQPSKKCPGMMRPSGLRRFTNYLNEQTEFARPNSALLQVGCLKMQSGLAGGVQARSAVLASMWISQTAPNALLQN